LKYAGLCGNRREPDLRTANKEGTGQRTFVNVAMGFADCGRIANVAERTLKCRATRRSGARMAKLPDRSGIQAMLPTGLSERCQHKSEGVLIALQDSKTDLSPKDGE
jgi:hypothetical protein